MADGDKKIGKGKGKSLKDALEDAHRDAGESGWFKVVEIWAHFENPLSDYRVVIQKDDPS